MLKRERFKQNKKLQKHGTEGKVNRMSDLISRKAVIDILENMIFEVSKDLSKSYLLQDARERIIGLNTAFDKEKVIAEIQNQLELSERKDR